jgi:hypothetical protein
MLKTSIEVPPAAAAPTLSEDGSLSSPAGYIKADVRGKETRTARGNRP